MPKFYILILAILVLVTSSEIGLTILPSRTPNEILFSIIHFNINIVYKHWRYIVYLYKDILQTQYIISNEFYQKLCKSTEVYCKKNIYEII